MRRGDVEVELRQGRGQIVEKTRPVEARNLDHGVTVRPIVRDDDAWRDVERFGLPAALFGTLLHRVRQPQIAFQRALDIAGDAACDARLVLVVLDGCG